MVSPSPALIADGTAHLAFSKPARTGIEITTNALLNASTCPTSTTVTTFHGLATRDGDSFLGSRPLSLIRPNTSFNLPPQ
jgi:hypothetical protein